MHIKTGENRQELMMFSYDMMVLPDNPVRLIDLMCKKFISDNPWLKQAVWKYNFLHRGFSPVIKKH